MSHLCLSISQGYFTGETAVAMRRVKPKQTEKAKEGILSCLAPILPLSCLCLVLALSLSCPCIWSCPYLAFVVSLSCLCLVLVYSLSCPVLSWTGHDKTRVVTFSSCLVMMSSSSSSPLIWSQSLIVLPMFCLSLSGCLAPFVLGLSCLS